MDNVRCENCKFFHKLKHNFQQDKGFEKSFACDVLLHFDEDEGWIQQIEPGDHCEMFAEKC